MTIKQFAYDFQGYDSFGRYSIVAKPHTFKWRGHEVKLGCVWELDEDWWYPMVAIDVDGQEVDIELVEEIYTEKELMEWEKLKQEAFHLTMIGRKKFSKEFLAMLEELLIKHLESLKEAV